jgi:hypothetical protein
MLDTGVRRRRRTMAAVAAVMTVTLAAAGCMNRGGSPWNPGGGGTPTVPPGGGGGGGGAGCSTKSYVAEGGGGGLDHGDHGGMDHGGGGGHGGPSGEHSGGHFGYDHPPTAAQKAKAFELVNDTRAAARARGFTSRAALERAGYFSIGDEMTGTTHMVHKGYHMDGCQLDPYKVEAYAIRQGRIVAAMYVQENGARPESIPDIAGNWTAWHGHRLPFRSSNPMDNGFYQLGGRAFRQTGLMLHVWLEYNRCGAFAGTDTTNMTGSCLPEANPPS